MQYRSSWRKAFAMSVLFHLCIWITGAFVYMLQAEPREPTALMEIDLTALNEDEESVEAAVSNSTEPEQAPLQPMEEEPLPVINPDQETVVEKVVENVPPEPAKMPEKPAKARAMGMPPVTVKEVYPTAAAQTGYRGLVALKVQITEKGLPGKIDVAVSSGRSDVNDMAIAAVKQWRFKPALDFEGQPMSCVKIIRISFNK